MGSDARDSLLAELNSRVQRLEGLVEHLVEQIPQAAPMSQGGTAPQPTSPAASRLAVAGSTDMPSSYTATSGAHRSSEPGSAKLLGAVGVLCFVLAGSYFIKLAIASGWITPTMQLIALVVFALSLVFAGFVLRDSDGQYASLLPASGVVLLYMAAYGGHLYFHLYDMSMASLFVNAVSISALVLYSSFRQHFYALAASIGTYLVPLLLGGATWSFVPLSVYVVVWNITFSVIAARLGSRMLLGLTAYLALFLVSFFGEQSIGDDPYAARLNVAVFQAAQFLFFCGMISWYSIKRTEPLSRSEAWSFFPLLLLFYVSEYALITWLNESIAPWCALGFGAWVYALYALAKRFFGAGSLESYPMVSCFLSLIAVHVVYHELSPSFLQPWLAVSLLLFYGRYIRSSVRRSPNGMAVVVLSLIPLIEYVTTLLDSRAESSPTYGILLNFSLSGALLFAAQEARVVKSSTSLLLGFLGVVQFLLGMKRIAQLWFEPVTAGYVTSALWSATALVLLIVAQRRDDRSLAGTASWLFGLTAIKVLLFDLSESGTTGRIVALMVIGTLFYAGGYLYRRTGARGIK